MGIIPSSLELYFVGTLSYYLEAFVHSRRFPRRFGSKTDGPSIASRPSRARAECRTRLSASRWKRNPLLWEKWARKAEPAGSSARLPAPLSSLRAAAAAAAAAAAQRPFLSGAPRPFPRSPTRCLPPPPPPPPLPPACSALIQWPTARRRPTTRATRARHPTSPGWTAAPTYRPCTTSCPPRAPPWAPWPTPGCPTTWAPRPPCPRPRTELRAWVSAGTAWTIRTKRPHRGSSISTPTVWITKTRQRGSSKCCDRKELWKRPFGSANSWIIIKTKIKI